MCDGCQAIARQQNRKPDNRRSRQARGYDAEYEANRLTLVNMARDHDLPCGLCGQRFAPTDKITAEHVIPLRAGGGNGMDNLIPAHSRCNSGWRRGRTGPRRP
jgi:5-methylcytosine-specific restriction endonuclease McrA